MEKLLQIVTDAMQKKPEETGLNEEMCQGSFFQYEKESKYVDLRAVFLTQVPKCQDPTIETYHF